MTTGKYLVVDARGFIPSHRLVDSLKEVREALGSDPDPVKQLVFKVVSGCWVDTFGMVRVDIGEVALDKMPAEVTARVVWD